MNALADRSAWRCARCCATRCARSSPRSASSSASARSSPWWPSAKAPRRSVEEAFASMGTNLLIVCPARTHLRRRARRLRLAAHAHLGRPEGDPGRGARRCATPRRTLRAERAGPERGPELDHRRSPAPRPTTSTSATGRWRRARASPTPTSRPAPRWSCSAQTVVDKLFGASADPVGQVGAHQEHPVHVVGVLRARRASRRWARTTTTPSFIPVSTFRTKIQGGLKNYINGHDHASAPSRRRPPRAPRSRSPALLRDRHHSQPGQDDDFSIRNLTEMASAQQEGTQDADDAARVASPRCRCWSAASAS